jgi:hypothetical protein
VGIAEREGDLLDDHVRRGQLEIVVGAESEIVVLALGGGVHPSTLVAREGTLFIVAGDDVLLQLWADRLEQISNMADDRKIPKDGVRPLGQVINGHDEYENELIPGP